MQKLDQVLFDGKNKMIIFKKKDYPTPDDLMNHLVRTNNKKIKIFVTDFLFFGLSDISYELLRTFVSMLMSGERFMYFLRDLSPIRIREVKDDGNSESEKQGGI